MATLPLRVQGDGAWNGWSSLVGGTTGFEVVDDSSGTTHDSATTYLVLGRLLLNPEAGRISFPVFEMSEGLNPVSLTVNVVAQRGGAVHPRLQIGFNRAGAQGFHGTMFDPPASWTLATRAFATNPITGSTWNAADLDGLELCVQSEFGVLGNNQITLVSGSIDYARGVYLSEPNASGARVA